MLPDSTPRREMRPDMAVAYHEVVRRVEPFMREAAPRHLWGMHSSQCDCSGRSGVQSPSGMIQAEPLHVHSEPRSCGSGDLGHAAPHRFLTGATQKMRKHAIALIIKT